MSKYIIVNTEAIQKRIEELEKWNSMQEGATTYRSPMHLESNRRQIVQNKEVILELKHILSQSTPLIPEIEKAFKAAKIPYKVNDYGTFGYENAEHYIENLKLDYDTTRDS